MDAFLQRWGLCCWVPCTLNVGEFAVDRICNIQYTQRRRAEVLKLSPSEASLSVNTSNLVKMDSMPETTSHALVSKTEVLLVLFKVELMGFKVWECNGQSFIFLWVVMSLETCHLSLQLAKSVQLVAVSYGTSLPLSLSAGCLNHRISQTFPLRKG